MTLPMDFELDAIDEVDAAFAWYEEQRPGLGEKFFSNLLAQLDLIQENPESWALLHRNVRACTIRRFPYVVYYRIFSDRINAVAVLHGHRHPRQWRHRL